MEERPRIRPGHGASHTESFADPALIWQLHTENASCSVIATLPSCTQLGGWMFWSARVIRFNAGHGTILRTQAASSRVAGRGSVCPLGGKAWMRAQMRFTQDTAAPGALMTMTLPVNARWGGGTLSPLPAICRDVTAAALVLVAGQPCRVSVSQKPESVSFGGLMMPTMKDFCFLGIQRGV